MAPTRSRQVGSRSLAAVAVLSLLALPAWPRSAGAFFIYDAITEPILAASLLIDVAGLRAHRTFAGIEVNSAGLADLSGNNLPIEDLSTALFGNTEALTDAALVDQAENQSGILSAAISVSFFPALLIGQVGAWFELTDTNLTSGANVFALDVISLEIQTATGTVTSIFEANFGRANDGFGIGVPDGGTLPFDVSALPSDGDGYDEPINGFDVHKVPEPATGIALGLGLAALAARRAHRRS